MPVWKKCSNLAMRKRRGALQVLLIWVAKVFFFWSALQSLNISLLTTKSDWHLISPNNINPGSKMKAMKLEEVITEKRNSWLWTTSPCQDFIEKCMKNNMEDLHTDVWAKRVKITPTVHKQTIIMYTKKLRGSDSLKTCAFSYNWSTKL